MGNIRKITANPFFVFIFIYSFSVIVETAYAEFTDREFHIHLGWAAISIAYCYIFKHKKPILILTLFFILTSAIDIAYAMTFFGVFTSSSVEAMAQTNISEASEFISAYFDPVVVVTVIFYLGISLYLLKQLHLPGLPTRKKMQLIPLFFFFVLCVFIIKGLIIEQRYSKLLPGIVGAYPAYLRGSDSLDHEIAERRALVKNNTGKFVNTTDTQQTYVFVIGEATTRAHMGIYGYQRPTTPHLDKRDDLLLFDNVISNFVQTLPSLRYALTQASTEENLSYREALSIVDAANLAEFETWWISNQQPLRGTYSAIGAMANHTTFISNLYFGKEVGRYDGLVLPELDKALKNPSTKKAIFIHLMGSHLKYDKRYPEDYQQFNSPPYFAYTEKPSKKQKHYIDTYDNSILYTDWLINSVIDQLKQKNSKTTDIAAISYIADHGEEIFDSLDFKGHGPDTVTQNSLDIPFIVWLSPGYKNRFSEKSTTLKNNIHKASELNHYFHFSLSLMNVDSPYLTPSKSLFNRSYQQNKRMVYGKDYDEEIRTIHSLGNKVLAFNLIRVH